MYQTINNQNIYYQKIGRGKDLILLHGWGQDVSTWWGITDLLKEDFTLWLLDLPGFGRSDLPKKPFKVSDYSETVIKFIKQNKIKKPILLGHSHGGRTGLKLAAMEPDLIDKLILEDASGIKPKKGVFKSIVYPIAKFSHLIPNFFNLKEKLKQSFYKSVEADYMNAGALKETLKAILEEDLTPDLSKIKSETILIWGEKDRSVSLKDGKKMYRMIENSRIEVLDDVGHFPHLENTERFVYWVRNFCE
jgi:pimeloyl-ACP methyl ester carboxylesterase